MVYSVPRVADPLTAATIPAALVGTVSDATSGTPDLLQSEFTRFERARILGARALQVSLGAPILLDVPSTLVDPVEIAELEFAAGVIPITVRRGRVR
jgi:DNA-directed RNA polymerase subunit K